MNEPTDHGPTDDVRDIVDSIHKTPIATVVTDPRAPDNPIIAVNDAFCALTGYAHDEVVGRNCRLLAGPATEAEASAELRTAIAGGRPAMVEMTNYRKDGSTFRNAVMIAPILGLDGAPSLFVGSQMDLGEGTGVGVRKQRARALIAGLSPRQQQVLRLMSSGYRNKQIAGELGIDEKTVKMHRARLIQALGGNASADAIRIAVEGEFLREERD